MSSETLQMTMLYFCLATLLLILHEAAGEKLLDRKNDLGSRRFTYEDGEYEISTIKDNWFEARNLCRLQGGKLLSIETIGENSAVLGAIYDDYQSESFWTSGTERYQEGSFFWDSAGGDVGPFTNWAINEPNNGNNEVCLSLNSTFNHLWADDWCYTKLFFVCEYHPCPNATSSNLYDVKSASTRFEFENSTYEISTMTATWIEAKNDCKAKGMELVSIEGFQENLAIMEAIAEMREQNFWTSGNDWGSDGVEGLFYWEATGQAAAPFTNWAPGMPDSAGECLALWGESSHAWNDMDCMTISNYICELKNCQ